MPAQDRPSTGAAAIAGWAVFAITAVALGIRLYGIDDSLLGDELSTYRAVTLASGPGDVVDLIRADDTLAATGRYVIELTPPLFFVLAWITGQVGDTTETIRIPSLVAGVLMIPLVYLIGVRTIGRTGAILAGSLAAFSPYLIYTSIDARAYGLAAFLAALSTLALLRGVQTSRTRWWVVYGAASCGVLYTHYLAVVVLVAQFGWALWFHREHVRPLVLANLAAAVAFLPWLGEFLDDRESPWNVIAALSPFSFDNTIGAIAEWSVGSPTTKLALVPGSLAVVLIATGLLIATIAWLCRLSRSTKAESSATIPPGAALVVVLALSTPVGLAVYSAIGTDVLLGRYLVISTPGLMLVFGALLSDSISNARTPLGIVGTTLVFIGFAISAVRTVTETGSRPDYKGVAEYVQSETSQDTPVFERDIFGVRSGPVAEGLEVNLKDRAVRNPRNLSTAAAELDSPNFVFVLFNPGAEDLGANGLAAEPFPERFHLADSRLFRGQFDIGVYVYEAG